MTCRCEKEAQGAPPLLPRASPAARKKNQKKIHPPVYPTNALRMFSTYGGIIRIRFRVGALTAPSQPAPASSPFLQYQHSTPRLLCQALSCTQRHCRPTNDMGLTRRSSLIIHQATPIRPYFTARGQAAQPIQKYTPKASILYPQPPYSGKTKGPAACSSQATSPFSCLNNFCLYSLPNFF